MSEMVRGALLRGALRQASGAEDFGREVYRVHHRYATEVVKAFALCPFLKDADSGFGRFIVMLDREPNLESATAAVLESPAMVTHLVYPLVTLAAKDFERFGGDLAAGLRKTMDDAPAHATFHPQMSGDAANPARLVGLVRRAPDPFVQFVPPGLQSGGTTFIGDVPAAMAKSARSGIAALGPGDIARLVATLDAIRADRDASYPPLLARLGD